MIIKPNYAGRVVSSIAEPPLLRPAPTRIAVPAPTKPQHPKSVLPRRDRRAERPTRRPGGSKSEPRQRARLIERIDRRNCVDAAVSGGSTSARPFRPRARAGDLARRFMIRGIYCAARGLNFKGRGYWGRAPRQGDRVMTDQSTMRTIGGRFWSLRARVGG